jgi:hypothetical protein
LRKAKNEAQDKYYGQLIEFTKLQYLMQDVKWMTEMKGKLQEKQNEYEKRQKERQDRIDAANKEKEERKKRDEERKQREADRKLKEVENKKLMEEQLRDSEIEQLAKLQEVLDDQSLGSNPLFNQIETCEQLKKYCQKRMKTHAEEEKIAKEEEKKTPAGKNELDSKLAKGAVILHPGKEEATVQIGGGAKKGKKTKKNAQQQASESLIEFSTVKKFNSLKISVPMNEEDYDRTIKDLDELKDALVYWGKIIQR